MSNSAKIDRIKELSKDKVPFHRYAFHNVYNYSLMGGVAAASVLTGNWWLAVVGAGMEALWMVFGPDSKLMRKKVFEPHHAELMKVVADEERKKSLAGLPRADVERFEQLERRAIELMELSKTNTRLSNDLMRDELKKTGELLASFLELNQSAVRYEDYLKSVDVDEIDREIRRYERTLEKEDEPERKRLAEKNLAVLEKRRERIAELRRFVEKARGQMELIENTFQLLGDQVVTMSSPGELGGQLDELIDGVEAVRSTAREAAAFIESVTQ